MPSTSSMNKCQFCVAYFPNEASYAEHSENCFARISAFLARDGAIKFACMVCRDVFSTLAQLGEHEQLHQLPGGFSCTICTATFLCGGDRVKHLETDHKIFECLRCDDGELISTEAAYIQHCEQKHNSQSGYALCLACGATFEEKSHLRFHTETECGYLHGWTCVECAAIFGTEDDLSEHSAGHSTCEIKTEKDDIDFQFEHVSTECPGSIFEDGEAHDDQREVEESLFVDNFQWNDETMEDVKSEDCSAEGTMEPEENDSDDNNDFGDESEGESDSSDESLNEKPEQSRLAENKYECGFCKKRYIQKGSLNRHQRDIHNVVTVRKRRTFKENKYKCDKCDEGFTSESKLREHRRGEHKFKCERCGFTTLLSSDLTLHLKTQCGRQPYFTCLVCNATFQQDYKFHSHKKTHSVFKCTKCVDTSFSSYRELSRHWGSHDSDQFHCTVCNRRYHRELALKVHMAKHFAVNAYKCHGCSEGFGSMAAIRKHRAQSTSCKRTPYSSIDTTGITPTHDVSGKWLECSICKDKFKTEESLETHKTVHGADGSKKYRCVRCPTFFASKDEKLQHIKEAHADELKCAHCIRFCTTRDRFNAHVKNGHLPHPKRPVHHTCAKCGMSFVSKQLCLDHERSNCGQDPQYKCEICDKALTNKYNLRRHISIMHQDTAKKVICSYCGKGWRTKNALQRHLVYHTGEKRYACSFCDKRFSDRAGLLAHEPIHTGIKPYMCQCGDRFSSISNLKSHRKARKTTCDLLPLVTKKFPTFDVDPATKS